MANNFFMKIWPLLAFQIYFPILFHAASKSRYIFHLPSPQTWAIILLGCILYTLLIFILLTSTVPIYFFPWSYNNWYLCYSVKFTFYQLRRSILKYSQPYFVFQHHYASFSFFCVTYSPISLIHPNLPSKIHF